MRGIHIHRIQKDHLTDAIFKRTYRQAHMLLWWFPKNYVIFTHPYCSPYTYNMRMYAIEIAFSFSEQRIRTLKETTFLPPLIFFFFLWRISLLCSNVCLLGDSCWSFNHYFELLRGWKINPIKAFRDQAIGR